MFNRGIYSCVVLLTFGLGVNVLAQDGAKTPPDFPKGYNKGNSRTQSNPGTQSLPEHTCPVALFNRSNTTVEYKYVVSREDPFDSTFSVPHPQWNTDEIEKSDDGKCLKPTSAFDEGRYFIYVTRQERSWSRCDVNLQYKLEVGKRYAFFINNSACLDLGLIHERD
jgi:hypothetical protein